MADIQDTDLFLVNRNNTSYQVPSSELMAELQDTDLMLVNRGGTSYKATGAEIKDSLKPPAEVLQPQIIAPADGAGSTSADAPPDPSGVNFVGSTFASSDGSLLPASADWQVALGTDSGYSSPISQVSKHPDMGPPPQWTSGELEAATEYRARTKYYATTGQESPWSDDITFKTDKDDKFTAIYQAEPSVWYAYTSTSADVLPVRLSTKLLTSVAGGQSGIMVHAIDGTSAYSDNISTLSGNDALTFVDDDFTAHAKGYNSPCGAIDNNKVFHYKPTKSFDPSTYTPTSLVNASFCGNMAAVCNTILVIDSKKLYMFSPNSYNDFRTIFGSHNAAFSINQPNEIKLTFSDPEEFPYRAVGICGRGYRVEGFALITNKGKLYRIGRTTIHDNAPVSSATPQDITPAGEKFTSLGMAIGAYNSGGSDSVYGFYAVTESQRCYGYVSAKVAGFPAQGFQAPIKEFTNTARTEGIISITGNYTWGGGGDLVRSTHKTVMCKNDGIYLCKGTEDSGWEKVSSSAYKPGDYLGPFTVNSGMFIKFAYPVGPQP